MLQTRVHRSLISLGLCDLNSAQYRSLHLYRTGRAKGSRLECPAGTVDGDIRVCCAHGVKIEETEEAEQ